MQKKSKLNACPLKNPKLIRFIGLPKRYCSTIREYEFNQPFSEVYGS
jgi:hypothetical protein